MPKIRVRAICLGERHAFIEFSPRLGLVSQSLTRMGKGGRRARVKAGYFGFPDHDSAQHFANHVRGRFPKSRVQVRESQRLGTTVEVKISGDFVEQLIQECLSTTPTTSARVQRHLEVVRTMPSVEPDSPSHRYTAPQLNRGTGRKLVAAGSRLVGID